MAETVTLWIEDTKVQIIDCGSIEADAYIIARTTANCLAVADDLGLESIALPAFGTGVGGFGLEECARLMLTSTAHFVQNRDSTTLRRVVFCLWGRFAYGAFVEIAREMWKTRGQY